MSEPVLSPDLLPCPEHSAYELYCEGCDVANEPWPSDVDEPTWRGLNGPDGIAVMPGEQHYP